MPMGLRRRSATRSNLVRCSGLSAMRRHRFPCPRRNHQSGICWGPLAPSRRSFLFWRFAIASRLPPLIWTILRSKRQSTLSRMQLENATSTWFCRIHLGLAVPTRPWYFVVLWTSSSAVHRIHPFAIFSFQTPFQGVGKLPFLWASGQKSVTISVTPAQNGAWVAGACFCLGAIRSGEHGGELVQASARWQRTGSDAQGRIAAFGSWAADRWTRRAEFSGRWTGFPASGELAGIRPPHRRAWRRSRHDAPATS